MNDRVYVDFKLALVIRRITLNETNETWTPVLKHFVISLGLLLKLTWINFAVLECIFRLDAEVLSTYL